MKKKYSEVGQIKLPVSRVFAKESAVDTREKISKNKINERTTTRYQSSAFLTKCALPKNSPFKDNASEDMLLPYRLYQKSLSKIFRKYHSAIKLEKKYEILYTEMRSRLHVVDPTDDVKAVTDIDAGYFRYLNKHTRVGGRPLYKSLKYIYNNQLRTKQEIGYRRDNILNIDRNHDRLLKRHQDSVKLYMEEVKQFEKFISEDYEKSIACLRKSESLYSSLIDAQTSELKNVASAQFSTQSKLIGIDYLYYQQQKYGRFLYYLSPPSWRAKHRDFACSVEIEAKGFDLGTSSEEDTINVILEKMAKECNSGLIPPALYFTDPDDLINIFETIEEQQLHHFTHVAQLKPHYDSLQQMIKDLKVSIEKDAAFVAHIIIDIEKLLSFDEERASQLEAKFMKVLHGSFYDSVAATDVLQLQMNLDWCYERIFGEKSTNDIAATAKALEDMYMEYTYKLEIFANEEAEAAFKQSVIEEQQKMKRAHKAARELRIFNQLEKSLLRAHATGNDATAPFPIIKRPSGRKPGARRNSQRELSEAEIEYLRLFTDWTEKDNPRKYLNT